MNRKVIVNYEDNKGTHKEVMTYGELIDKVSFKPLLGEKFKVISWGYIK